MVKNNNLRDSRSQLLVPRFADTVKVENGTKLKWKATEPSFTIQSWNQVAGKEPTKILEKWRNHQLLLMLR
jgi:hypothetical protein